MSTITQLNMNGEEIFSNTLASFANSKSEAISMLGSAEKIGDDLFVADSMNKRAFIYNIPTETITWQYDSDRYIVDFHLVPQDDVVISLLDDSISESETYIRQNTFVIWENNSSAPVSIYSGTTTYDDFQLDPNLNLYGTEFSSEVLQPGDKYTFKFSTIGEYNWFTYPDILTATINVTENRLSSRDQFIITESDNLDSPFSSRVIKVDTWGNILWSFGENFLVKPRDARALSDGKVIIST